MMLQTVHLNHEKILSYVECGDKKGYPILVQHGLIASIKDGGLFEGLVALGARVISIARPGYGESSPYLMKNFAEWGDIVAMLINELGLDHFDVLGISSGAPYGYSIGNKFPDKVGHVFILSGMPALYDEGVRSHWPYPLSQNANMAEMEKLAAELFFSNLSADALQQVDIHDSMRNHCFGVAQDLRLRGLEWGFRLSEVNAPVTMQHSRFDPNVPLIAAEMTSKLLPDCRFEIKETNVHFSKELLDDFARSVIAKTTSGRPLNHPQRR